MHGVVCYAKQKRSGLSISLATDPRVDLANTPEIKK